MGTVGSMVTTVVFPLGSVTLLVEVWVGSTGTIEIFPAELVKVSAVGTTVIVFLLPLASVIVF
jgi:hypothetical protein